ncbi:MAG: hypothetical protein EZS28_004798 [Streblomastix strix]|uniref:BRCT domain-containing protein n=1 Tax=Streblomastix strix TaxID=222440 RepID=A0A5J4WZQ7_9EUKA|nr:MAG: hypothetical protein EZS28_004798 [Streblomastix strix]
MQIGQRFANLEVVSCTSEEKSHPATNITRKDTVENPNVGQESIGLSELQLIQIEEDDIDDISEQMHKVHFEIPEAIDIFAPRIDQQKLISGIAPTMVSMSKLIDQLKVDELKKKRLKDDASSGSSSVNVSSKARFGQLAAKMKGKQKEKDGSSQSQTSQPSHLSSPSPPRSTSPNQVKEPYNNKTLTPNPKQSNPLIITSTYSASADSNVGRKPPLARLPQTITASPSKTKLNKSDTVDKEDEQETHNRPQILKSSPLKRKRDLEDQEDSKQNNKIQNIKSKEAENDTKSDGVKRRRLDDKEDEDDEQQNKTNQDILGGLTFVLSGFINPERGDLVNMIVKMGAAYTNDFSEKVTHVVGSSPLGPKVIQGKADGLVVVNAKWLRDCYKQKKRLDTTSYKI